MTLRRIAHVVGLLLLIALVAPFFVYAVPGAVGADHSFVVLSGSMEPELAPGDVVIVAGTDPATIDEGDVITYAQTEEDTPVTHRVIDVQEQGDNPAFQTQGDANPEPDTQLVPAENVLGSVVLTIPLIGYVIQFGGTTPGIVLLVGVPVGLLVLSELWSLLRSVRTDSDDVEAPEKTATSEGKPSDSSETRLPARSDSTSGETGAADGTDPVGVHVADLTMTLGVLTVIAPYSIYVAVQLRTPIAITAAFAACFSTLALGSVRLLAYVEDDGRETRPTATDAASKSTLPVDDASESALEMDGKSADAAFVWDHSGEESPNSIMADASLAGSSDRPVSTDDAGDGIGDDADELEDADEGTGATADDGGTGRRSSDDESGADTGPPELAEPGEVTE